jgi:hypothetical protein
LGLAQQLHYYLFRVRHSPTWPSFTGGADATVVDDARV